MTTQSSVPAPNGTRALLLVVATGSFLGTLTSSVINVALPDIARDFGLDPSRAAWLVLSFLLTVTVLLLPAGRLGDLIGHRTVYLLGAIIFAVGSLLCAIAPTSTMLLFARVLQAVGSAQIMATSPALLTKAVPVSRRGFALGFMSTGTYLGLTIGPPVGGILMEYYGWRSIFYASVVAGCLVCISAWKYLPVQRREGTRPTFDFAGSALIAIGTLSFLLLCTRGPAWGFGHPATWATALVSVMLVPPLLVVESRHPSPAVDPKMFRSRVFTSASLSAMLNYVSLFTALYVLPFALRDGQGLDPSHVGKILASQAAAMALLAWASGSLSDRIGSRGLAAGGMAVLGIGMAGMAWTWPPTRSWIPAAWLFVSGAGTGVFVTPNSSALMGAAPRERQGVAGGMMSLARNLGMSLGVALGSGIFAQVFVHSTGAGHWDATADQAVRLALWLGAGFAFLSGFVALASGPRKPHLE